MDLASKYRPSTFEDVTEQGAVVEILRNVCNSDELVNRNFLFIGPAGTGKTTLARVLNNVLNEGEADPIEVDAASYSGVDHTREIIKQMQGYPLKGKYKVFIIDECFPGNHSVVTDSGCNLLKDVKVGDVVLTNNGYRKVSNVFVNKVFPNRLTSVNLTSGSTLVTTKDHLFFTQCGWVEAKELNSDDCAVRNSDLSRLRETVSMQQAFNSWVLLQGMYDKDSKDAYSCGSCTDEANSKDLSNLWKRVQNETGVSFYNLFVKLCWKVSQSASRCSKAEREICSLLARIYLSCVWQEDDDTEQGSSKILQLRMRNEGQKVETAASVDKDLLNMWEDLCSKILKCVDMQQEMSIRAGSKVEIKEPISPFPGDMQKHIGKNEAKQSNEPSGNCSKDDEHKEKERHSSRRVGSRYKQRRKRETNRTSNEVIERVGYELGSGVRYNDTRDERQQSEQIPIFVQSRPSLSKFNDCDRGGWQDTLLELCEIIGLQENGLLGKSRVESVTFYERGNNEQLFENSFTSEQLHSEYVDMYDLEVEGCHNYFVEGVLVHNCHALSSSSWQAMLKTLEEPPARTVTCLCTTNPEKIPATILSRVQTFQLSKISLEGIVNRLKYILQNEGYSEGSGSGTYTDEAVNYIAKLAKGGMRDSITLLTKVLAYSNEVNMESVTSSLSLPNYDRYFDLLNFLVSRNNESIVKCIDSVYNSGVNFVEWFAGFHSFICNIIKYICMQDISKTMIPSVYEDKLSKYTTSHLSVCLKLTQKLLDLVKDLKGTQYLQETAITYLCSASRK